MMLAGCADSPEDTHQLEGADAEVAACVEGAGTCAGNVYSVCHDGVFVEAQRCQGADFCVPGLGCVACNAGEAAVCDGDTLYACGAEGERGAAIRDCESGCANGQCVTACAPGAELVYVVDVDNTLLSFDPRTLGFIEVGRVDCPAGAVWPDFGRGASTPFSMAVDRQARAWVLYSSGEIFWVDTGNANCQRSPFVPGSDGFDLFGMAFVSDGIGTQTETLHVAGGRAGTIVQGRLGTVSAQGASVTAIGPLPARDFGAELTGNGNGELWAYWPGPNSSVARVDKAGATVENEWRLPGSLDRPVGWAFAHWGGQYFVFLSRQDALDNVTSQVLRFDPASGQTTVAVEDTGRRIVGAGVSTCAPVVSNF